ncbi:unnamed protein product, partial [Rotaria magnacalcarata]
SSQYLTMTEELCTAYKHVKEVFGKVGDELKLTKPESEGSVNVTTDPDLGEGKFGFLKFKNDKKTANSNRLSQELQQNTCIIHITRVN